MQRIGYLLLLGAAEEGTHAVRKGDLEGKEQNEEKKEGRAVRWKGGGRKWKYQQHKDTHTFCVAR